ncbi:unnamed protein product [Calypogeia fissa]
MNLNPLIFDDAVRASSIIQHEIGHALAFEHEHQSPKANIDWYVSKVLGDFKKEFNWQKKDVYADVIDVKGYVVCSDFDALSIMNYVILPGQASRHGKPFELGQNCSPSAIDEEGIAKAYPRAYRHSNVESDPNCDEDPQETSELSVGSSVKDNSGFGVSAHFSSAVSVF